MSEKIEGDGFALAHIDAIGEGYGFRKIRGTTHVAGPGTAVRVDAATIRRLRNVGDTDAVYVCAGGKDGYVGRDGRLPEGESSRFGGSAS